MNVFLLLFSISALSANNRKKTKGELVCQKFGDFWANFCTRKSRVNLFNVKISGEVNDGWTEEESEMQCDKSLLPNEARKPIT